MGCGELSERRTATPLTLRQCIMMALTYDVLRRRFRDGDDCAEAPADHRDEWGEESSPVDSAITSRH